MKPIDRKRLKTVSAKRRASKVRTGDFARPVPRSAGFSSFYRSLPDILRAADLKELAKTTARAHRAGRAVAWGIGGHVVKVGLAPLLADLMQKGLVTSLLMNGAAAIHDYEIALMGRTSEEVGPGVRSGTFGMAEETGAFFARAAARGREIGLGEALKEAVKREKLPHRRLSLLGAAEKHGVPVTVHVAIGTDIVHMHPACDGAALGEASHKDFLLFAGICGKLHQGVYLNWGSAVLGPEVFVKAVTLANNLRNSPLKITTANFDQLRHYRPRVNVVERPAVKGYDFAGHHEIMLPLFRMALLEEGGGRR
ncbi:MAG: GSU2086 family protein [Planctomycetota bacterium]